MAEAKVSELISKLQGKAPWDVRLGQGSFLTMEFGKPEANPSGKIVHGEWHLWLYMCHWRFQTPDKVLAGSEDDRDAIQTFLEAAVLDNIEEIHSNGPSNDLSIRFKSGLSLHTFSSSSNRDEEQWELFTPEGRVLLVYGGGTSDYVPVSEPRPRA